MSRNRLLSLDYFLYGIAGEGVWLLGCGSRVARTPYPSRVSRMDGVPKALLWSYPGILSRVTRIDAMAAGCPGHPHRVGDRDRLVRLGARRHLHCDVMEYPGRQPIRGRGSPGSCMGV
jgi:hypothetical protein